MLLKAVKNTCGLALVSVLSSQVWANNAALDSFIQRLDSLNNMQAEFVQVTKDKQQRVLQQLTGTLQVEKPGKMNWQTEPPYAQLVISDGEVVWIYDMDLEQVTIRDMEQRIQETPALLLSGDSAEISDNFIVTQSQEGEGDYYILEPKDKSQLFEKLEFEYQGKKLKSMNIFDAAGQITEIAFKNYQLNKKINPHTFIFAVPEGVDVIDGRHED